MLCTIRDNDVNVKYSGPALQDLWKQDKTNRYVFDYILFYDI